MVSWFKAAAFERQQVRAAERRLQADWLAEAAVNRAAALLDKNSDYAGETWNLSAAELAGSDAAAIEIRVAPVTDRPERRSIQVAADFPADSLQHSSRDKRNRGRSCYEESEQRRGEGRSSQAGR